MNRGFVLVLVLFATAARGQQTGEDPVGVKMLLDGAREGDKVKVKAALKRGVWINQPDPECKQVHVLLSEKLQRKWLSHACVSCSPANGPAPGRQGRPYRDCAGACRRARGCERSHTPRRDSSNGGSRQRAR